MKYAIAQGAEYTIWLNDDCYPQKGSLEKLQYSRLGDWTNSLFSLPAQEPRTGVGRNAL
jgi:GT2 family glycosyltransferase